MQGQITKICRLLELRLNDLVPAAQDKNERCQQAIRYSLLAPGKRIRPLLTILVATQLGASEQLALNPACAVEMVHTASLILDDLPCMDNAALRRGQPCNHAVYGEATANLAAVALLTRAFGVVSEAPLLSNQQRLEIIRVLANAIGNNGIIAGQESDLHVDPEQLDPESIIRIYGQKTAALFVAAAEIGACIAGITGVQREAIGAFAHNIGLVFQMADDVLDNAPTTEMIGKDINQDVGKSTFISLLGQVQARELAKHYLNEAITALLPLADEAKPLIAFSRMLFMQSISQETEHSVYLQEPLNRSAWA
jgi:geranylgeranyl diphosphate synthase, type II